MASTITKSKGAWTRLLLNKIPKPPIKPLFNPYIKTQSFPNPNPHSIHINLRSFSSAQQDPVYELLAEVEREKQKERDAKRRDGIAVEDDEEDFLGVQHLIDKLEKRNSKEKGPLELYEEPTDSESDDDDERFTPDAIKKREELLEKKLSRHKELLKNFVDAETLDESFKWMNTIDKFEQKHLRLPLEYRVIGEMMNRLKDATGKEKFMLQQKLNRAMRLVQWKEAYDPNNPDNYGVIQNDEGGASADIREDVGVDEDTKQLMQESRLDDDDEEDFESNKDDILLEKLNAIDKILEEKLALLDHTFGKKGRALEEEIKDLAEERNTLTEEKTRPLYRKGFDVRLIDVNRTCKVTKGGQIISYSALVACGNYHGVVGFAKAKAPAVPIALQKAYEKCFQNLHTVERHEEHTIAHAVQTKYKKTKVYLWPAATRTGMKASKTVQIVLHLAGYKNIKSKVIGSRNPHNTVKALFQALNAIESPKDVQQKLGRTVVESYLL